MSYRDLRRVDAPWLGLDTKGLEVKGLEVLYLLKEKDSCMDTLHCELVDFTEMMRGLGYVRIISMENFRKPNFPLVAEVLVWLVKRYDPSSDMTLDIDSVQDRVLLIKSVVQFMSSKAHLKLSTKRLYQADGYAVKELLKVTSVLYNAIRANSEIYHDHGDDGGCPSLSFDISSKLQDLKHARHLASEITAKGANLYDLLNREVELREIRSTVISRQLELNDIEKKLKQCIEGIEEEIKKTRSAIDSVRTDEATLEAKMEKKRFDLERNRKRLETLQSVRPAYMDDYDKLEEQLHIIYDDYLLKFRNMAYLEEMLDEFQKAEQGRYEEFNSHLSEVRKKSADNRTEDDETERSSDGLLDNDDSEEENVNSRQRRSGSSKRKDDGLMVRGGMRIPDKVDDDEEDSGSDSDDDEEDDDDEDDDRDASDESSEIVIEEGIGGIQVTKIIRPGPQRKSKWKQLEDDDDDDDDGF